MPLCAHCRNQAESQPPLERKEEPQLTEGEQCDRCGQDWASEDRRLHNGEY